MKQGIIGITVGTTYNSKNIIEEADRAKASADRVEELLKSYITDVDTLIGGES